MDFIFFRVFPGDSEMQVQSLGQEDPLEKEMSTCSSILTWKMLWTEEPGGLPPVGLQKAGQDWPCTWAGIPLIHAPYCASAPHAFTFPLSHWNSIANYRLNSHMHSDFHCPSFPKSHFRIKLQCRLNLNLFLLSLSLCGICAWETILDDLILNSQPSTSNEFFVLAGYYVFFTQVILLPSLTISHLFISTQTFLHCLPDRSQHHHSLGLSSQWSPTCSLCCCLWFYNLFSIQTSERSS